MNGVRFGRRMSGKEKKREKDTLELPGNVSVGFVPELARAVLNGVVEMCSHVPHAIVFVILGRCIDSIENGVDSLAHGFAGSLWVRSPFAELPAQTFAGGYVSQCVPHFAIGSSNACGVIVPDCTFLLLRCLLVTIPCIVQCFPVRFGVKVDTLASDARSVLGFLYPFGELIL